MIDYIGDFIDEYSDWVRETFEHFLNTADLMKSSKPLSISIFDYLKRFDSGLRHLVKVLQTLVNGGFEAFFILFEKLYKVVQSVNTRLTPISLPFARYLFLLHADRYNVAS